MSTQVEVILAHAEPKHIDNSKIYAKSVADNNYAAYHEENGNVWINLGIPKDAGPIKTKGCPFPSCCVPLPCG